MLMSERVWCLESCESRRRFDRAWSCHSAPQPTSRSRAPRPGYCRRRRRRSRDLQVRGM